MHMLGEKLDWVRKWLGRFKVKAEILHNFVSLTTRILTAAAAEQRVALRHML